jgi:hypothetical protein
LAKKRKQKEPEEEEDVEIQLPKFDDEAFLKEETRAAKVTFIAVGYGAVCGFVTFILFWIMDDYWQVPVALGFILMAGIIGLLMAFKIDIKELNWKNWVGGGVSYLAAWLIVFIIFINMPIYDMQSPDIKWNRLYSTDQVTGNFTEVNQSSILDPASNHTILVVVTDNSDVQSVELTIVQEGGNVVPGTSFEMVTGIEIKEKYDLSDKEYEKYHDHFYEYSIPNTLADGPYTYEITAKDDNEHKTTESGKFYIGD